MTAIAYSFPTTSSNVPLVLVAPTRSKASVYRRRRIAAASLALSITLALGFLLDSAVSAITASSQPALIATVAETGPTSWTVKSGDTLWSIASATHPGEDPRPVVAAMQKAGAPTNLQLGDVIAVP